MRVKTLDAHEPLACVCGQNFSDDMNASLVAYMDAPATSVPDPLIATWDCTCGRSWKLDALAWAAERIAREAT